MEHPSRAPSFTPESPWRNFTFQNQNDEKIPIHSRNGTPSPNQISISPHLVSNFLLSSVSALEAKLLLARDRLKININ